MAGEKSINPGEAHKRNEVDPFARAVIYRLRRDALMIVSNLNRGRTVSNDTVKRQLVFVQAQLCTAAVADPRLSGAVKTALVQFQAATVSENIQDRRGERRRRPMLRGVAA